MKSMIRYQWQIFWLALTFFSRIPMPSSLPYSEQRMNHAGRYFGLVGLIIGALLASFFLLIELLLPLSLSLLLTIVFGLLLTGGFHEDGLADMTDGVGGGFTIERRLAIMKDSRLGTYGALALVVSMLLRYQLLLLLIPETKAWLVFVLAHGLSRAVAGSLIFKTPYVSDAQGSKSKPLANHQNLLELVILITTGTLPLVLLPLFSAVVIVFALFIFRLFFRRWLLHVLGGFTGDCLGAAQQISELLIYSVMLVLVTHGYVFHR